MVIVQMLVCFAIIIMYMESFDTFAVSGQKAFYIQPVYMGMSDIDQRLRLRYILEDPEILLIAEEMHAMLLPAQIFDHEIHLHLRCYIRQFFHDPIGILLLLRNFFRFKLQLRIMEYHMAHMILHRQRKYPFIAFHKPYILFRADVRGRLDVHIRAMKGQGTCHLRDFGLQSLPIGFIMGECGKFNAEIRIFVALDPVSKFRKMFHSYNEITDEIFHDYSSEYPILASVALSKKCSVC